MSHDDLTKFFEEKLAALHCESDVTRQYITGIFRGPPPCEIVCSSTTLLWERAKTAGKFEAMQRLADEIFWARVFAPELLMRSATCEYHESIGALAYARCYLILKRQWRVYEELADRFGELARESRSLVITHHLR